MVAKTRYCSFCGRAEHEAFKLVLGPAAAICDQCIELCGDVVAKVRGAGDPAPPRPDVPPRWPLGTRVRKRSGSSWQGRVVGFYRTALTPAGYCVESEREPGSVQIYPQAALEEVTA